jgi:hypothetical protein
MRMNHAILIAVALGPVVAVTRASSAEKSPTAGSSTVKTAKPPTPAPAASAAPAPAAPQGVLACAVECDKIETRRSLFLEYELCEAREPLEAAAKERRVFKKKDEDQLSSAGDCLTKALTEPGKTPPKTVQLVIEPKSSGRQNPMNQAPSGNFSSLRACLSPFGLQDSVPRAHRDLARNALAGTGGFRFGGKLVEIAAEQADTYEWNNEAAHAQTKNGSMDAPAAIQSFESHLQGVTTRLEAACCHQDYTTAAYELGYLFHGIQDLATHAGMTNAYHAYLLPRDNPDLVKINLDRAQAWTIKLLNALKATSYKACVQSASNIPAAAANWEALATAGGYTPKDATKQALATFLAGAAVLQAPPTPFWYDQKNAKAADDFFDTHVLQPLKARFAVACTP